MEVERLDPYRQNSNSYNVYYPGILIPREYDLFR